MNDRHSLQTRHEVSGLALPRLRRVRQRVPLTQGELAERSGIHRVTIARLELGGTAQARTIRMLARALEVTPADLFDAAG